jgi:hypothetical protein
MKDGVAASIEKAQHQKWWSDNVKIHKYSKSFDKS